MNDLEYGILRGAVLNALRYGVPSQALGMLQGAGIVADVGARMPEWEQLYSWVFMVGECAIERESMRCVNSKDAVAYQSLLAQIELAIKAHNIDYAQGMVQALSVLGWLNSEEIAAYKDAIDAAIIKGLSHE